MMWRRWIAFFWMALIGCFSLPGAEEENQYSLQEALKVFRLIEEIQEAPTIQQRDSFRMVVVTESELNSYIAYRIDVEKETIMKALRFKLFKKNKIEGKIFIDLHGHQVPKLIRPQMTFYFSGRVEVKDNKVRLVLQKLFLESQPIQPQILDLVSLIVANINKSEVVRISDWYDLPFEIRNIKTQKGKAVLFY